MATMDTTIGPLGAVPMRPSPALLAAVLSKSMSWKKNDALCLKSLVNHGEKGFRSDKNLVLV